MISLEGNKVKLKMNDFSNNSVDDPYKNMNSIRKVISRPFRVNHVRRISQ